MVVAVPEVRKDNRARLERERYRRPRPAFYHHLRLQWRPSRKAPRSVSNHRHLDASRGSRVPARQPVRGKEKSGSVAGPKVEPCRSIKEGLVVGIVSLSRTRKTNRSLPSSSSNITPTFPTRGCLITSEVRSNITLAKIVIKKSGDNTYVMITLHH